MTTGEFCARMAAIASGLRAATERLNTARAKLQPTMREAMASEPGLLPPWRAKRTHVVRTVYMRRQMGKSEVDFLQHLMRLPDPLTALATYRAGHHRVLTGKRKPVEAAPDVSCSEWRQRPERHLTARQMAEAQFTGKSLERELRRINQ
jgi:hypothetical protein